jgi:proteasome lid subunit RPN8/RPN11
MRKTTGEPASVEFDASWAMAREESRGDVVGFYHTHPSGVTQPSRRDDRTMHAWVSSFGRPLLCLIEADRIARAFRYDDDTSPAVELATCELFPRGWVVVADARLAAPGTEASTAQDAATKP